MATLSNKRCIIDNIRPADDNPGLRDHEASFLRLLDKISNGCKIEINHTGTSVFFIPGVLIGGKIKHECPNSRSLGYILEAIVALAPFCKKPLQLTLIGVTNEETDSSVDIIRTVTLPLLRRFGLDEGLELKISKRGAMPLGGGEIYLQCPVVRTLKSLRFMDFGKIKRIRGIAYSMRVSPATANRVVDSAREKLNKFIPDVYIYTDHYKGVEAGNSPGFGLSLVAETTTGALISADCVAAAGELPEALGVRTSNNLFEEISRGGCVDTQSQSICLLFMVLGPEDVSKVRFGKLSPYTVQYLRDLKDFFGVTFKITTDEESKTALLSCMGVGFSNLTKKIG